MPRGSSGVSAADVPHGKLFSLLSVLRSEYTYVSLHTRTFWLGSLATLFITFPCSSTLVFISIHPSSLELKSKGSTGTQPARLRVRQINSGVLPEACFDPDVESFCNTLAA